MFGKNVYSFEGLECPHCAEKIENHLNEQSSIKKAKLKFKKHLMYVKYNGEELSAEQLVALAKEVKNLDIKITKIK